MNCTIFSCIIIVLFNVSIFLVFDTEIFKEANFINVIPNKIDSFIFSILLYFDISIHWLLLGFDLIVGKIWKT